MTEIVFDPSGPFTNNGPPPVDEVWLNHIESVIGELVAKLNTLPEGTELLNLLQGFMPAPPDGGRWMMLQYSTNQSDARISSDVDKVSVFWLTTYSGHPTNAAPHDQHKVVVA